MSSQLAPFVRAAVKCRASRPDPFEMMAIDRRALLTLPYCAAPNHALKDARGLTHHGSCEGASAKRCALRPHTQTMPQGHALQTKLIRWSTAYRRAIGQNRGDFSGELDIGEDSPK